MESEKSHVFSLLFGFCFGVSRWNTKKNPWRVWHLCWEEEYRGETKARRHVSFFLLPDLAARLKLKMLLAPKLCGEVYCFLTVFASVHVCVCEPTHVRNVWKCICKIQDTKRAAVLAACLTSASSVAATVGWSALIRRVSRRFQEHLHKQRRPSRGCTGYIQYLASSHLYVEHT